MAGSALVAVFSKRDLFYPERRISSASCWPRGRFARSLNIWAPRRMDWQRMPLQVPSRDREHVCERQLPRPSPPELDDATSRAVATRLAATRLPR